MLTVSVCCLFWWKSDNFTEFDENMIILLNLLNLLNLLFDCGWPWPTVADRDRLWLTVADRDRLWRTRGWPVVDCGWPVADPWLTVTGCGRLCPAVVTVQGVPDSGVRCSGVPDSSTRTVGTVPIHHHDVPYPLPRYHHTHYPLPAAVPLAHRQGVTTAVVSSPGFFWLQRLHTKHAHFRHL